MAIGAVAGALLPLATRALTPGPAAPIVSGAPVNAQRSGGATITVAPTGLNVGEILQAYTTAPPENGGFGLTPAFMGGGVTMQDGIFVKKTGLPIALIAGLGAAGIAVIILLRRRR